MRTSLLLALLFFHAGWSSAQDTLERINKTILVCKILEVSDVNVVCQHLSFRDSGIIIVPVREIRRIRFANGEEEHWPFSLEQAVKMKIDYFEGVYYYRITPLGVAPLNKLLRSQHDPEVNRLVKESRHYGFASLYLAGGGLTLLGLTGLVSQQQNLPIDVSSSLVVGIITTVLTAEVLAIVSAATSKYRTSQAVNRFNKNFLN